ncbi:hypothetical protein Anapl_04995 [Anas platyrhynchos]|uniref:Uncharacterized protein n=1 Tax=Anas platyrhynchos TaxID=8839 RepID=R0LW51_ANAPL|nr:hypothetical protein Anapl_04995 [Anas platyrhynchos]
MHKESNMAKQSCKTDAVSSYPGGNIPLTLDPGSKASSFLSACLPPNQLVSSAGSVGCQLESCRKFYSSLFHQSLILPELSCDPLSGHDPQCEKRCQHPGKAKAER